MDETSKNKCQYCGKEYKNVPVHERFCKLNPEIRKSMYSMKRKGAYKRASRTEAIDNI